MKIKNKNRTAPYDPTIPSYPSPVTTATQPMTMFQPSPMKNDKNSNSNNKNSKKKTNMANKNSFGMDIMSEVNKTGDSRNNINMNRLEIMQERMNNDGFASTGAQPSDEEDETEIVAAATTNSQGRYCGVFLFVCFVLFCIYCVWVFFFE